MSGRKNGRYKIHYFRIFLTLLLLIVIVVGIIFIVNSINGGKDRHTARSEAATEARKTDSVDTATAVITTEPTGPVVVRPEIPDDVIEFSAKENREFDPGYIQSPTDEDGSDQVLMPDRPVCGVLVDTEENEVVAEKDCEKVIYPASLTKVMTLIVATEYVEENGSLDDTVTITADMIDPMIEQHASRAGFEVGDTPTVEQVLYGVALPSGADAALAAAVYTAGSEAAFVGLMNEKAEEMGLEHTHFTNVVGLHDEDHYSTALDMAMILEYAEKNELCSKILSTYQYFIPRDNAENESSGQDDDPGDGAYVVIEGTTYSEDDGIILTSTLFSRMEGTEMPDVTVVGGKTGYTDEAGQCLETFAKINGKTYVLVLTGFTSKWQIVYATLTIYSTICAGGSPYVPPK